jgi:uncharacterized membrane protein
MFWLSHHYDDELDRCYRVGGVHVCARCLGTYPVLFAVFVMQMPHQRGLDYAVFTTPLILALTLPATLDWAYGRFRPHAGSNLWRTLTGVLLGVALGRTLFLHIARHQPEQLFIQFGVVTAIAVPVILTSYLRRRRG